MEQMGMDEEAAIKYLNVSTMFIFVKCITQKYEMTLFIFKENERPQNHSTNYQAPWFTPRPMTLKTVFLSTVWHIVYTYPDKFSFG